MKYALIALVGLFGLSACTALDRYLPRENQCQLLEVAKTKAAEQGLNVDEYLDLNNIFVCADVKVVE